VSDLTTLPGGGKWHSYSGVQVGGPAVPATVELVKIPSTGLKDSYVKIIPFYGTVIATATNDGLGIKIFINQVAVYESQTSTATGVAGAGPAFPPPATIIELFIPQQSELQILSLNTANNTLQNRGVAVLGWWL